MKIRNIIGASLLFTTTIAFTACGGKSLHTKQVKFLAAIYINLDTISSNLEAMTSDLDIAFERIAIADTNFVGIAASDSFKTSYTNKVAIIESSIKKIQELENLDKETNILQKTIDYVTKSKEIIKSTMDMAAIMLEKGKNGLSKDQRKKIASDLEEMTTLEREGNELMDALTAFATKNKITDEELNANGVGQKKIFR